jgi:hypothetical protein
LTLNQQKRYLVKINKAKERALKKARVKIYDIICSRTNLKEERSVSQKKKENC